MNTNKNTNTKLLIYKICDKYSDIKIQYHKKNRYFHYYMHEKYNNELLISIPNDSLQILMIKQDLDKLESDNIIYYIINWGKDIKKEYDNIWIWWNEVKK